MVWYTTLLHEDWNIIVPRDLWGPTDALSVLGSRRGSQGLLLALCDFPSREGVSTGSGEGSKLEGRPGTPLQVYLGSSQSEGSNCRPLSRCWGLSPQSAAANGCLSSCSMNAEATADCLQFPPQKSLCCGNSQWLEGWDLGSEKHTASPSHLQDSRLRASSSLLLSLSFYFFQVDTFIK